MSAKCGRQSSGVELNQIMVRLSLHFAVGACGARLQPVSNNAAISSVLLISVDLDFFLHF